MSPRVILSISTYISIKFFVTWLQACLGPLGKPRYRSNSRRFSLPANRLTTHQLASEPNVSILGKADRERLVHSDGSSAGLTTFSALRNSPAKAGDLVAVMGIGSLKRRSNRLASIVYSRVDSLEHSDFRAGQGSPLCRRSRHWSWPLAEEALRAQRTFPCLRKNRR